jgi:hypothetical protein
MANDTDTRNLTREQLQRATIARMAAEILATRRSGAILQYSPSSESVIKVATWIADGVLPPVPSWKEEIHVDEQSDPITTVSLTNTMLIEMTYDSPISQDTVDSIVASHEQDEGILRVRGRLVP